MNIWHTEAPDDDPRALAIARVLLALREAVAQATEKAVRELAELGIEPDDPAVSADL